MTTSDGRPTLIMVEPEGMGITLTLTVDAPFPGSTIEGSEDITIVSHFLRHDARRLAHEILQAISEEIS